MTAQRRRQTYTLRAATTFRREACTSRSGRGVPAPDPAGGGASPALATWPADALRGGGGLASPNVDTWLSLFNLAAIAIYTYLAIGTAYGSTGVSRFVCAGILAVAVGVLLVGYRFMIFLITLYTA